MRAKTATANQRITRGVWASLLTLGILLHASAARAQVYTIAPTPFQTELDNSGNIVVGGCIWTYAAGTTTPITTYSNNAGSANSNPIIADASGRFTAFLLAGTSYKFVYEDVCTPPAHATVFRTADNIAGVPSSATTVDFTCTAGEALSAGQTVYLSDGSGGKNAGQCYKADSANAYSSTTAIVVGMVPSAIASGSAGTMRLAGALPGLSSLSVGSTYYVGTGGAVTTTGPLNARALGVADTATSLVLSLPAAPSGDNGVNDFRLTLTSGTPVTSADVTAATTIYCTPAGKGNRLVLFNSNGAPTVYASAEFSIAVPATTSQMYDVFAYANSGVPTLELLAWTNDTTRATAIVLTTTGTYTKSGDLTRRYLGSVRTTTVSGQTEDSYTKRYLFNYYHRVNRPLRRLESTATWNYTTATWRQANAAAANQVEIVNGVAEEAISVFVQGFAGNSGSGPNDSVAVGENSTTTPHAGCLYSKAANIATVSGMTVTASLTTIPAVGYSKYVWLEIDNVVAGTTTWTGVAANVTQSGIWASWRG